jgi:beta-lactamase superfamily II metal-dependent hydrolase
MAAKKKKASKPKKKPAGAGNKPKLTGGEIQVRMYRQGLGDCFLLTFGAGDHVLIDCGVLAGTPDGPAKIRAVANDIKTATGGHLRALVATHEHWDHVSGFKDAVNVFDTFTIDETWVAWTEEPGQDIVAEKRAAKGLRLAAMQGALGALMQSQDPSDSMRAASISETLNFLGGPLLAFSENTEEAMNWATDSKRKPKYFSPGDEIERAWMPNVKVHVLGPPKNKKSLNKLDGEIGTEMYGMRFGLSGEELGFALAFSAGQAGSSWLPFEAALQWRDESAWITEFGEEFEREYRRERWRRVDTAWLASAADLALQLDNATNNTSLVLAFECGSGDVLMFVADAQIGNWLSWAPGSADLLKRTCFYKVGHHGSHNATLKEGGLEAMTHPGLVAAIPVDEKFAKAKKPNPWMMPADALYATLKKKTKGRILRADKSGPVAGDPVPAGIAKSDWDAFVSDVTVTPLYVEYRCRPSYGP